MEDALSRVNDARDRIINALYELGLALNTEDPDIRMAIGGVAMCSQKTDPTDDEIAAFIKEMSTLAFRAISLNLVFSGDACYSMEDGQPMRFCSNEWKHRGGQ